MAGPTDGSPVHAGGGVLWRKTGNGLEIAVVHRPRYDDWSLPKGKLTDGESVLAAAVREVREETGAVVAVSRRLPQVRYDVAGRPKIVDYWAMRETGGTFEPSHEVDKLDWLPAAQARDRLSYEHDRGVLDALTAAPPPDAVLILVRHASAGHRSRWAGDDRERPLDDEGRRQARALAPFLALFAPERVLSADLVRCVQTVEPLAHRIGRSVELAPEFADESYLDDAEGSMRALQLLGKPGAAVVVCSQGDAIPGLITRLGVAADPTTRKGACWVLSYAAGAVISADYYPSPL